jgi:dienelactone hydrolase
MIAGYDKWKFSSDAMGGKPAGYDVYSKGEGPVIVLIQELPGIGMETLRLADKLVAGGFRVVMPHLFGPLGRLSFLGNTVRVFCMRREFKLFAKNRSSPIVEWLKALCQHAREKYDVQGVGVIGMCLTGNFAISLMADDAVLAGVASQPSLPLFAQSALHMSDKEIAKVRERLDEHGPMMAYRFKGDKLCTAGKFEALDAAFNDDRERIKLNTLEGNKHAVMTVHFIDEAGSPTDLALKEVMSYFGDRLNA